MEERGKQNGGDRGRKTRTNLFYVAITRRSERSVRRFVPEVSGLSRGTSQLGQHVYVNLLSFHM